MIFGIKHIVLKPGKLLIMQEILIETFVRVPREKVWELWTEPDHITQWNFAIDSWHCPKAENNLEIGGEFHYDMAARDGSYAFDFWGTYTDIEPGFALACTLGDGRKMNVTFEESGEGTRIVESFEPEDQNSIDMQREGWQAILENFREYAEGNVAGQKY